MLLQHKKCTDLQQLHLAEHAFVIPNPWDVGSAKLLQGSGFKALATTSSALAYTMGKCDGEVTLEEKLSHCRLLAANTNIPINADFEDGFADSPEQMVIHIKRLVETGVAGCSIEDFSRTSHSIFDFEQSVERIQAAAEYISSLSSPFQLTARAENLLHGITDLENTVKRLKAYEKAGAHVLYAPGICSLTDLRLVTNELNSPFNVLAPFIKNASVHDFEQAGAQRISLGGALNWSVVTPLINAANEILNKGTFDWTSGMTPSGQVNEILKRSK